SARLSQPSIAPLSVTRNFVSGAVGTSDRGPDKARRCAKIEMHMSAAAYRSLDDAPFGAAHRRRTRDRDIREFLVLEPKIAALELAMQLTALDAHRTVTPIFDGHRTNGIVRTWRRRVATEREADFARAPHDAKSGGRSRLDDHKRGLG